jgi:cobalt-zinc-cadmium efflux system protein
MEHNHQPVYKNTNPNEHLQANERNKNFVENNISDAEHEKLDRHAENGSGAHLHNYRSYERKRLIAAIILTSTMMVGEIVGGLISGSLALLSDAGHMLTHAFALLVSFLAILYARRPATNEKSFGFYRAEVLAALFNGITLIIITGFIVWESYKRILNPRPIASKEMIIIAVIGLVVNIVTAMILWEASRQSLNIRSAFIHMIGDTGSSVAVVIGAVIIYFTGLNRIDSIFSILIAILILIWSFSLIRDSVRILMESTPKNINVTELKNKLISVIHEVKDTYDIHVWEITTGIYCMTAHMVIEDMNVSQTDNLLTEINHFLEEEYNIIHPIIQLETGHGYNHDHSNLLKSFKSLKDKK